VKPHHLFLLLLASMALAPAPAVAWTQLGHQLVGDLAASRLTPQASAQVARLLAGESDPTLGGVASWADGLRDSDPRRFKDTSGWHYIDSKDGTCAFVLPRDCPDGNCVIAAIEAQRKVLADRRQPQAARRDALKFLVHFIGDLHQPLHAGNHADSGGNQFQVSLRTDLQPQAYARKSYVNGVMGTNLHAVWDYYILASARLTVRQYTARLQSRLPRPSTRDAGTPLAWARESCELIDALKLYPRKHAMDHAYLAMMRPVAERRIELAAVRLAALLNETLGGA
jgi:hypothetical protein